MSELYKATSPKNPDTNYTEEVVFEKDNDGNVTRSIRVGGEAVALSEEELASARKYLNVRAATDEENKDDESSDAAEAGTVDESAKGAANPPDSPAAAEARTELGQKSRRGGGDK